MMIMIVASPINMLDKDVSLACSHHPRLESIKNFFQPMLSRWLTPYMHHFNPLFLSYDVDGTLQKKKKTFFPSYHVDGTLLGRRDKTKRTLFKDNNLV